MINKQEAKNIVLKEYKDNIDSIDYLEENEAYYYFELILKEGNQKDLCVEVNKYNGISLIVP